VFVVPKTRGHHEHIPQLDAIPRQVNTAIIVQIFITQTSGFSSSFQVTFTK